MKKSAAKSDSPRRGRMMARSTSCRASPDVSAGKSRRSGADNVKSAAAAYYQPLDAKCLNCVRAQSVSRGYSDSSPDFFSFRPISARGKSVQGDNGSNVGCLRCSVRISSRAQSVEQRGQSVARSSANKF